MLLGVDGYDVFGFAYKCVFVGIGVEILRSCGHENICSLIVTLNLIPAGNEKSCSLIICVCGFSFHFYTRHYRSDDCISD